ncbi:cell division initiation protein [Spirosomataceae bacterium TFI 002]|nr:cell division initiation protein [Spirosomataceae bacterium TFI 002]
MKITSLEIKQHEFEKAFRGYDIEEVDIFLTNIANEWERISNENKMLRMQLEIAEKEATKLREVEMTLIKTLRSAEDTSTKITDHAKFEASKTVEDAKAAAQNTINDAKSSAENTINDAEQQAQIILENAKKEAFDILKNAETTVSEAEAQKIKELETLESNLSGLKSEKVEILSKLKAIHIQTENALKNIEGTSVVEKIETKTPPVELVKEIEEVKEVEIEVEEQEEEIVSVASSANSMTLADEEITASDDLEIIEGIGPKIAELLSSNGVRTYRELATSPVYKIKDILNTAGPHYAMHDPTTWVQQALLAEEGKFDELEQLKAHLIAGRKPEVELEAEVIAKVEPKSEEVTEEMLDRVNKVKAALRKAMQDKETTPTKNDTAPKTETLNDLIGKQRDAENGGSFFDNIK